MSDQSIPYNRRADDPDKAETRRRTDRRRNRERRDNAPSADFINAAFSAHIVGQTTAKPETAQTYKPIRKPKQNNKTDGKLV